MYLNIFEYLRGPVTEIQSQMYYVTREDINRALRPYPLPLPYPHILFETGYQRNRYQVPLCIAQN